MHDLKEKKDNTFLFDELNGQLQKLLSQWFSLSFLDLQQITWQSPCDIVEKVCLFDISYSYFYVTFFPDLLICFDKVN